MVSSEDAEQRSPLQVWVGLAAVGTFVIASVLLVVAVRQLKRQIDLQATEIALLRDDVDTLRSALGPLVDRGSELERALDTLPARVAQLELPVCSDFARRGPPRPTTNDDQPVEPKAINAAQWRRLAEIRRELRMGVCITDLRVDRERDAAYQLEVALRLGRSRRLEIDLHGDGRVAEAELEVGFRELPTAIRKTVTANGCRPTKSELSIRTPVAPADVRRLVNGWHADEDGRYPPLGENMHVELDCGPSRWDLELAPDGAVTKKRP